MTTTIIVAISLIALLALAIIGAYKGLKLMASKDMLFVCFVPINEAVGIRRGGTFHRFLFDPTGGTHLNNPQSWQFDPRYRAWERMPNTWNWCRTGPEKTYRDERNWFTRFTGIYFFLPFIEEVDFYPFDWTTYTKTEVDTTTGKKTHRTSPHNGEEVRSVYAKTTTYYGEVMVLTQDAIDVLVNFTFDVDLTNPFVARFARGNFLGQVKNRLEAELRNYIGKQTFSELFSETDTATTPAGRTPDAGGHGRFYEEYVRALNESIEIGVHQPGPGIKELYGVEIKAFHILDMQDLAGQAVQQVAARQRLEIAKRDKLTAQELADARAIEGDGTRRHDEAVNAAKISLARALMEVRTVNAAATRVAVAETLFTNAQVVNVGGDGLNTLINLNDLGNRHTSPATTATAPAAAVTQPAARPAATATPARAGRTGI